MTSSWLNIKWWYAFQTTPPSPPVDLPAWRMLPPFEAYMFAQTQIPFLYRIIATNSGLNIKWCSVYALPSERRHPRLMWTCQLREQSRHLRLVFLPKITNSIFVQDNCDNFWP